MGTPGPPASARRGASLKRTWAESGMGVFVAVNRLGAVKWSVEQERNFPTGRPQEN